MYSLMEPVQDVAINVFDPIGEQILRKIIARLGYEDVLGERIAILSDYKDSTVTKDKSGNAPFMENKLICRMSTNMDPRSLEWETLTTYNISSHDNFLRKLNWNYPVFSDNNNRLLLTTQFVPCIIQLECDMQLLDPNLAHNFMSKMFSTYSNGETIAIADATYDYPIPKKLLMVLFELFKLTNHHPVDNFVAYLRDKSKKCIGVQSNRFLPSRGQIIVEHVVSNLLVKLDYADTSPQVEKRNKLTLKYLKSFTITIQVSRPSEMYLMYPLTVGNKHIPMELIPIPEKTEVTLGVRYPNHFIDKYLRSGITGLPSNILKYYSTAEINKMKEDGRYGKLLKEIFVRSSPHNVIPSPNYDQWQIPKYNDIWEHARYNPIASFVFLIDEETKQATIDVPEAIRALDINEEIVEQLLSSPESTILTNEYPVHLQVYRDDKRIDNTVLEIDASGKLTITSDDVYRTHRLIVEVLSKENKDGFTPIFSSAYFNITVSKSR